MKSGTSVFDACVVGAGPAGCTLAMKLARLGLKVALIERAQFPRRHLGESLSPGVLPMLQSIDASAAIENAGFRRVHKIHVLWDQGEQIREEPEGRGIIVDRAHFDAALLALARGMGIQIFQPASVISKAWTEDVWRLLLKTPHATTTLQSRFLCEATGRSRFLPGQRKQNGPKTLAVYAYWTGTSLPGEPRIEAGENAWFWGVPLPDNTYNTLAFVDARVFRDGAPDTLTSRFRQLLAESGLFTNCGSLTLSSPVRAVDATPYLAEELATENTIRVGDSALALDPISSSGVQKAIQSALSGALVVNTLLRRPADQAAAIQFHTHSLTNAALQHRMWAGEHYRSVFAKRSGDFWETRASGVNGRSGPPAEPMPESAVVDFAPNTPLALSPGVKFVKVPCLGSDFVEIQEAIVLPSLKEPVAYLGGIHLASLLLQLPPVIVLSRLSTFLGASGGGEKAGAIAAWLLRNRVLEAI